MKYYEYIWLDGNPGDPQLRSKTKIVSNQYRKNETIIYIIINGFSTK